MKKIINNIIEFIEGLVAGIAWCLLYAIQPLVLAVLILFFSEAWYKKIDLSILWSSNFLFGVLLPSFFIALCFACLKKSLTNIRQIKIGAFEYVSYFLSAIAILLPLSYYWGVKVDMYIIFALLVIQHILYYILILMIDEKIGCNIGEIKEDFTAQLQAKNIKVQEINQELSKLKSEIHLERYLIKKREDTIKGVINGDGYIFNKIPSFVADMQAYDFSITENYLNTKKHPAHKKAMEVSELKLKYKEAVIEAKISKYKLEGLVNIFPELENFIHSEEDFRELDEYIDVADVKDNYDRVRYYVTKDEYEAMSTTERNQLALDRYINRPKTKGEIGIEYELCCARVLESMFGYKVIEHGLLYGKHDLGRDLICHDTTNNIIYIVQCKFWSRDREIRENVIMQLHGSAVAYGVTYNKTYRSIYNSKIVPVLMMPPQSVLSDTAKEFVEYLNIKVWRQKMCDFPRIKCNINNGNKIYHLPFDQQYKRTIIDKPGEFYAYTVVEAEAAGFRRAMRHFITN